MAGKKRRLGRPLRAGGPRLTRTYRADKREYEQIQRAARAKGLPTCEWVRVTLIRAARRTEGS